MTDEQLNYVAILTMKALKEQGYAEAYLEEKREILKDTDKFKALLFLNNCDSSVQEHVAKAVGISLHDLKSTVRVLTYF